MPATQGETIRVAREARRMTQAVLAKAAGVSSKTVGRAERDEPLAAESVLAICAVLGIEASSLRRPDKPVAAVPARAPVPAGPTVPRVTGLEAMMVALIVSLVAGATLFRYVQAIQVSDAFHDRTYMRVLSDAGYQVEYGGGIGVSRLLLRCTRVSLGGAACPEPPVRDGLPGEYLTVVGWKG